MNTGAFLIIGYILLGIIGIGLITGLGQLIKESRFLRRLVGLLTVVVLVIFIVDHINEMIVVDNFDLGEMLKLKIMIAYYISCAATFFLIWEGDTTVFIKGEDAYVHMTGNAYQNRIDVSYTEAKPDRYEEKMAITYIPSMIIAYIIGGIFIIGIIYLISSFLFPLYVQQIIQGYLYIVFVLITLSSIWRFVKSIKNR
ncbi:MAG TPA: hypothetical protein PLR26_04730 [Bacilli bacterium]|nr:hypothetical protein [Bacilli bacterium]